MNETFRRDLVQIKYLRLILSNRIFLADGTEGHITFAYFGKVQVDVLLVGRILRGLSAFTLTCRGQEKLGKNLDIDAMCYDMDDSRVDVVRACLLRALGPDVESQNYVPYMAHVTNLTQDMVDRQGIQSIKVLGVESNDGTQWRMMFS
jgi:hypothetical protein